MAGRQLWHRTARAVELHPPAQHWSHAPRAAPSLEATLELSWLRTQDGDGTGETNIRFVFASPVEIWRYNLVTGDISTSKKRQRSPIAWTLRQLTADDCATGETIISTVAGLGEADVPSVGSSYTAYKSDAERWETTMIPSVNCGGHTAPSCFECPTTSCGSENCGAGWCNGECTWDSDAGECTAPAPPAAPCTDTDDGATDPFGDGCSAYAGTPGWCGDYDDDDFTSSEMCCACGGGTAGMKSEEQEANARVRELQEIKAKQKAMEEAAHKQKAEEDKEAAKQAVMDLSDLD